MKFLKQSLAVLLSLIIVISCIAVVSAADSSSSASNSGKVINFNSGNWKNFQEVYCHIWERGKDSFYSWLSKAEKCSGSGKNWQYDVSGIDLKSGTDYCLIFSTNIGHQTYDITFGTECIGDTLRITGEKVENPLISSRKDDEAVWFKNGSKYGPHLAISSVGNIVGNFLCPNEKGTEAIGDWLSSYYDSEYKVFADNDFVDILAKAYPKFGVKTKSDIDYICKYISDKKTGKDEKKMKEILEDAFYKAYPPKKDAKIYEQPAKSEAKQISSNGGLVSSASSGSGQPTSYFVWNLPKKIKMNIGQTIKIKTGSLDGKKKFTSSKKKVAAINSKGKVTAKKPGTTIIKAKIGALTFSCKITVRTPKLSKKKLTLTVNKTKTLKVKNYNKKVKWKSSNKKVATVNSKGVVKAKKKGKVIITANLSSGNLKCKITVKK